MQNECFARCGFLTTSRTGLRTRKNNIVVHDELAEHRQLGYFQCPASLFDALQASLSPYINRFLSADTIVPGYANPQSFNRYSYVTNNPLRYTDPTGHYCVEENGGRIIRIACESSEPIGGGGSGNGGGGHEDDDHDDNDYCSTHPTSCALPPTPDPVITLPAGGDYCSTHPGSCGVPTVLPSPVSNSSNNFWAVVSAFGDIGLGGAFASLSVYALIGSCVYAGPACVITAPVFFTTAVIGAQGFANGVQSLRQMNDPSITPTGREVIDFVFPFLRKRGK